MVKIFNIKNFSIMLWIDLFFYDDFSFYFYLLPTIQLSGSKYVSRASIQWLFFEIEISYFFDNRN